MTKETGIVAQTFRLNAICSNKIQLLNLSYPTFLKNGFASRYRKQWKCFPKKYSFIYVSAIPQSTSDWLVKINCCQSDAAHFLKQPIQ